LALVVKRAKVRYLANSGVSTCDSGHGSRFQFERAVMQILS